MTTLSTTFNVQKAQISLLLNKIKSNKKKMSFPKEF